MSGSFDFQHPWMLLLLPLALLPFFPVRRDVLAFAWLNLLPEDRLGRAMGFLWRLIGAVAIAAIILALAGPGHPETQQLRVGRGAEILVLMDRSRSMDERMLPSDWRTLDPTVRLYHLSRGSQKAQVARDVLAKFVAQRPNDRFSLMFFSTRPLNVVPFTQHDATIQAAITAGEVGRGIGDTDVGRALLAAIDSFAPRTYSGSRIILLVSDGGTHLDDRTRERIREGLRAQRIALYWIYLRSYNAPSLDSDDPKLEAIGEIALHRFFQTLDTPYRNYQADSPEDIARAVADVGRQQNLPLDFYERIPREDYSKHFLLVATLACAVLLAFRLMLLRSWE